MATYLELKAQADALAQQAEEVRLAELDSIIAAMREQIAECGITPEQLFGRRRAAASGYCAPFEPKYRDPKTGATWSGRGKPPQWIASAKNRDRFLIPDSSNRAIFERAGAVVADLECNLIHVVPCSPCSMIGSSR
jgi:DNA-binding protein H-NS